MRNLKDRSVAEVLMVLACLLGVAAACGPRAEAPAPGGAGEWRSVVNVAAAERFRRAGKGASLTVLPTDLAGSAAPQVGEVVAMLLERGGMTRIEAAEAGVVPPAGADMMESARRVSEFARENPGATEFVLFTAFLGTPSSGVSEVRAIVVTREGEVAWMDRLTKGDADFDRLKPHEPMQGCVLVAERLRPVLGLSDPMKAGGSSGKLAQRWEKNTGVPSKAERAAIEERGKVFKKAAASARLVVYPSHAGGEFSAERGRSLAAMIKEQGLMDARASEAGPRFEIASSMNEQKVLWSMARGLSDYVRANPPDAEYVLLADYLTGRGGVGGVHFAVCDREGELVVVDLQNNHWPDFKSIGPRTVEDCDRLVVKRLRGYLD